MTTVQYNLISGFHRGCIDKLKGEISAWSEGRQGQVGKDVVGETAERKYCLIEQHCSLFLSQYVLHLAVCFKRVEQMNE